ncbi:MAG: hypothetical protein ABI467_06875 [Kofleriaceae bacterium]
MTKLLLLASLLLPVFAHADKPAAVLIEAVHKGLGIDVGDAGFKIFEDGRYRVYRHDPKAMASLERTGQLTSRELAAVRRAAKTAAWKVTHHTISCEAMATSHTEWSAGKHAFDQRLCGTDSLDAGTEKLFAMVDALETKYATTR